MLPKLSTGDFNVAYEKVVLNNDFFEKDNYYIQQKPRYFNSLKQVITIPLSNSSKVLEIGGGQIVLLLNEMYGIQGAVADVNEKYQNSLAQFGINFRSCDLLHDDLPERDTYDLVVLCEVIEHMPVPPYIILEKIKQWIKPGGWIFLTTPNLYRLRNLVRLALGMRVFDTFFIPEKGQGIGHPIEYSKEQFQWQLEKAGFHSVQIDLQQLDNSGASLGTQIGRMLLSPLLLRPLWRDKLVAIAQKPLLKTV
ncbi:unknown [Crocosphaera subtropica ATCC 51142]|uniref:Uncharacterized protein n=1 Tax=Crocosphaera subtropica (strain ATCC 51142 / BH68) TaxID=43989 RepID=B1WQ45_CROS5|nr:class I SAM-dependent methyltransferase [Crocosphaera subtropica]ACB49967.1 unknown [Crocosphaera subtropica ATCC 51142]